MSPRSSPWKTNLTKRPSARSSSVRSFSSISSSQVWTWGFRKSGHVVGVQRVERGPALRALEVLDLRELHAEPARDLLDAELALLQELRLVRRDAEVLHVHLDVHDGHAPRADGVLLAVALDPLPKRLARVGVQRLLRERDEALGEPLAEERRGVALRGEARGPASPRRSARSSSPRRPIPCRGGGRRLGGRRASPGAPRRGPSRRASDRRPSAPAGRARSGRARARRARPSRPARSPRRRSPSPSGGAA